MSNDTFYTKEPFCHGLVESKIWLCEELEKLPVVNYDFIYIVGSWTGNAGLFLHVRNKIKFKRVVLVDSDLIATDYGKAVLNSLECQGKLAVLNIDCNKIYYEFGNNLIINTSVDNIAGSGWFDQIPAKATVALQSRDGSHHDNYNTVANLDELKTRHRLTKLAFAGDMQFDYGAGNAYTRSMIIGSK